VRVAHTSLGTVDYRIVGSGPPLVMIIGYDNTMDYWDPRLVDALAKHYRVVIFDNAGIGDTQQLPGPLTIDAMARQTGALIETLRLSRPDVLGWSMGGMIAQALAVLDPSQVRRPVLCAKFPGTDATVPSATTAALTRLAPQQVETVLFPANQTKAYNAFAAAISGYPPAAAPSKAVLAAQRRAVTQWGTGKDPAGRKTAAISAPTLIADGRLGRPGRQRPHPRQAHTRRKTGPLPGRCARIPVPERNAVRSCDRILPRSLMPGTATLAMRMHGPRCPDLDRR
jgi:pimeloyl-ACP methyl ester carboxylesterase